MQPFLEQQLAPAVTQRDFANPAHSCVRSLGFLASGRYCYDASSRDDCSCLLRGACVPADGHISGMLGAIVCGTFLILLRLLRVQVSRRESAFTLDGYFSVLANPCVLVSCGTRDFLTVAVTCSTTDGITHATVVRIDACLCADTASIALSLAVVLVLMSCWLKRKSHCCWCQTLPLRQSVVPITMSLCALVHLRILTLPPRFQGRSVQSILLYFRFMSMELGWMITVTMCALVRSTILIFFLSSWTIEALCSSW